MPNQQGGFRYDDSGNLMTADQDRTGYSTLGGGRQIVDGADQYKTVAASQTDSVMGATGAQGDYLKAILVVPAAASPGSVQIKDGTGSAITVYVGGATITTTAPFYIPLGITSSSGAWKITTGAGVSCVVTGRFT